MQPDSIILNVLREWWFFIPIFISLGLIRSRWFKGIFGEFMVNGLATALLDKREYHLLKNVMLATNDGTTQIDHVLISKYGIFVVETKHMKGWIFGQPNQRKWTQKIYQQTNTFQNPLHQNFKHCKTLEKLLNLKPEQLHSVIVFTGDSQFKTTMPANVTRGIGYITYIKSKKEIIFNEQSLQSILTAIEQNKLTASFKTHRTHVKHVKKIVADKKAAQPPLCLKCGGNMVLRETKRGPHAGSKFWGCKHYPTCKGTSQI